MKTTSTWVKALTLVFFFGAIACIVAFRTGAFDSAPQEAKNGSPESTIPDSPKVEKRMIYGTKSGKVIELNEKTAAKPDSQKEKEVFIISSSKSMALPPQKVGATEMPDSVKKASKVQPMQKRKMSKKAKQKANRPKNNNTNNTNNNVVIPSSKSGPVFVPNN